MIDKQKYLKQVEMILANSKGLTIQDFMRLFDIVNGYEKNNEGAALAERIVKGIFSNALYNELMIPWSFFDTELGRAILKAKYGFENTTYLVSDIVALTGLSRQHIARQAENGVLKGIKKGGTWLFSKEAVDEYLSKKKISKPYTPAEEKIINPGYERDTGYNYDSKR